MLGKNKRLLNICVIILLTAGTSLWTFFIFHQPVKYDFIVTVTLLRLLASFLLFKDYSLSWSKASPLTFMLKSVVYLSAFAVYAPLFYGKIRIAFMLSELTFYLFIINFSVYAYYYLINRGKVKKTERIVIYGAGKAGVKLFEEFRNTAYRTLYFVDDDPSLQNRSIDGIKILSKEALKKKINADGKLDRLFIAMPSARPERLREIYERLGSYFNKIYILPPMNHILQDKPFSGQLKEFTLEDLLSRKPNDLDEEVIRDFVAGKTVMVTGAGGSIGSEIVSQCLGFGVKNLILVENSEFNLYGLIEKIGGCLDIVKTAMVSVADKELLESVFRQYKPQIVIHAAAYKHVPLVEMSIREAVHNNIRGTVNCIDLSIKYNCEKFVLISTDKAVRPTNVMGCTKRVCELYAQNVPSGTTEIVSVRFGNVLGSSGSVIPKFRKQIEDGGPVTVTHPEITRYFMLINEACSLVLQAASLGKGGEIFILDMGSPVKILDLAKKIIELSGVSGIEIKFTGLRPGEKLYEELLINDSDQKTRYESIMVAAPTVTDIKVLLDRINEMLEPSKTDEEILNLLKNVVPEFCHMLNCGDSGKKDCAAV